MKFDINTYCTEPLADLERNKEYARALNLPGVGLCDPHRTPLAVVGGGPSIKGHEQTLRDWLGNVWAVNGALPWCQSLGIDATFFSIDASHLVARYLVTPPRRAIVATVSHPNVFRALETSSVQVFDVNSPEFLSGATSSTATPLPALRLGYRSVTFFGCESAFPYDGMSHVGRDEAHPFEIIVECGGSKYRTDPEFLLQATCLAEVLRSQPDVFSERSGGLLTAMVKHGDYDVVAGTRKLAEQIGVI